MNAILREEISGVASEIGNHLNENPENKDGIHEKFRDEVRNMIDSRDIDRTEFEKAWENGIVFSIDSHLPGHLPDEPPVFSLKMET